MTLGDLSLSEYGDSSVCWDNDRFTFDRCCFQGEAAPGLTFHKLRPALLTRPASRPAKEPGVLPVGQGAQHAFHWTAGRECWVDGFTYAACCRPDCLLI